MPNSKTMGERIGEFKKQKAAAEEKIISAFDVSDAPGVFDGVKELKEASEGIAAAEKCMNGVETVHIPLNDTEKTFLKAIETEGLNDPDAICGYIKEKAGANDEAVSDAFIFLLTWKVINVANDAKTGKNVYGISQYGRRIFRNISGEDRDPGKESLGAKENILSAGSYEEVLGEIKRLINKVEELESQIVQIKGVPNAKVPHEYKFKPSASDTGSGEFLNTGVTVISSCATGPDTATTVNENGDCAND